MSAHIVRRVNSFVFAKVGKTMEADKAMTATAVTASLSVNARAVNLWYRVIFALQQVDVPATFCLPSPSLFQAELVPHLVL
ncbi:MAG TPA: hypothetical protein VJ417_01000, partial [Candidatus Glassbacteria bacterium]|nr:hypothetical protein [Candidatus Glassbacteria bacterium]